MYLFFGNLFSLTQPWWCLPRKDKGFTTTSAVSRWYSQSIEMFQKLRNKLATLNKSFIPYKKLEKRGRRKCQKGEKEVWIDFFNFQNINAEHFCFFSECHPNFDSNRRENWINLDRFVRLYSRVSNSRVAANKRYFMYLN